ncbi:HAMP domain-containing sensor histidine kinase [Metasolibacillus meyeri]|uniref:histidine kinase n=1 Tax=Metasolibacillus meyeri TaxID=1071052 RepID=A0AAW9NW17_9BACL|nr:HAMP domain-containing sensor histidine kinase [Metasolibacillus meyeri]MEC1180110.1 HAMP domain-containing sensor histidine kinase [Metasolibacillus meyeri]
MKKLTTKIWLLMCSLLVATIAFMYILSNFIYEELYVSDMEQSMIEVGEKLQTMYRGGKVDDALIARVEDFNAYSHFQIFAVRNPRELSACVPFDIDYDALIGPVEREQLLKGQTVTKVGYEKRFDRPIISVILPFTEYNRLEGIIYVYYPLTKISELATTDVGLLIGGAALFSLFVAFFIAQGLRRIMRPLHDVQRAAEKMSEGHYEARVNVASKDEVGQLAEAFNQMAQAIQQEDEQQKTFLATVSHELRTPISYVKGYSEAIGQNYMTEEEQREAIQLIAREAGRMERLTNELLQLARTTQEQEELELYPIALAETVREVTAILHGAAQMKQIEINEMLDEELIVLGDEEKLKQILINILENALRYSSTGSKVQITTVAEEQYAIIAIKDTGIGIPAEDLPHITERFYRVNKARSRSDGGSGLGLSIVEQLVKLHKGQLTIESELGKGTYVYVKIPLMEE